MGVLLCMICRGLCVEINVGTVPHIQCGCTMRPKENEFTDLAETTRRRLEVEQVVFGRFDTLEFLALA